MEKRYIYRMVPLRDNVEEMFIGPFGSSLKNDCFVNKDNAYCMVYEQKHAIKKTMDVDTRYVDETKYDELKRFNVRGGDIIVSCRGTIGETFIIPDDAPLGIMHPSVMKIRLKDGFYNRNYFNLLLSNCLKKHESEVNGSGIKMAISATELGKELFPVPTMAEQDEITLVISRISGIIKKRKNQLQELDNLIKSRFVEMFGDPNDEESKWEKKPLGELCTIVRGGSPRPIEKFLGGKIPWIKIGDATQGDNIYLHSTKEHIIEEGINKSRYVKKGSMIFANCGVSLGFARIITFDGCIHDGWLAFQDIDKRLNDIFLLKALNMCTDNFRRTAPDGTQPNLNTAIMKAYLQIVPPVEKQKEFVRFCEQVDKLKVEVQKSLNETQILFNSLMQKYFE